MEPEKKIAKGLDSQVMTADQLKQEFVAYIDSLKVGEGQILTPEERAQTRNLPGISSTQEP